MSSGAFLSTPTEADWDAAVGVLTRARDVAIVCHLGPDGDAVGSLLGLSNALRAAGHRVVGSFGDDPFVVPPVLGALPGADVLVPPADFPTAPELLVTLDTGSIDRLGTLADRVEQAGCVLVVDHHATNTRFGDVHLLDSTAPATAAMVAELVDRMGLPLTAEIAAPLYTGLVTDTGSFKYSATTPATHALAARLLATGIRHDLLSRALFDTAPFGFIRLLGVALSRATLEPAAVGGLGLVWTATSTQDLLDTGTGAEEAEGVIDVLRTTAEAEVAVVVKGEPDGSSRVSTRSKGAVDLGAVCAAFGGGGHRFAAGYSTPDCPDVALVALRESLAAAAHLPT